MLSSIDPGAAVEAGEHADEQCRADMSINNVPSPSTLSADVDSLIACVVDVDADPQLASAIADSRTKQLETPARCIPIDASTINVDDDDDDDDEDIDNNVVIDPVLPTTPHPLITGTREAIDRPSVDVLEAKQGLHLLPGSVASGFSID